MPPYLTHLDIRQAFIPGALTGGAEVFLDCFWTKVASEAPAKKKTAARVVVLVFDAMILPN